MNDLHLDDETLSAFLDDELDAAQRSQVAAALEADAGAKIRLERMRSADQRLRREIPAMEARTADPLAEYILRTEREAQVSRVPRWRGHGTWMALAAGVAGVTLGFMVARTDGARSAFTTQFASGPLSQVLETRASGEKVTAGSETLTVLLSMSAADGRACRLFASQGSRGGGEGLACREAEGWRVIAWDGMTGGSEGFHPAGASPLLDAAMDRLSADTLDADAERALISRQWRVGPKR
jgi:hypothetical protein